mmetsp:Transcript_1380/g.1829  ORF Transcript_1380/g.1829 Transcript_1380/m.1829 type:complete len:1096 (-) Transcript_1380:18-3305(-)
MDRARRRGVGVKRVLVANRGEIALRLIRAVGECGLESVAIYSEDDSQAIHTQVAGYKVGLEGKGTKVYLDKEQIVEAAKSMDCQMVLPGYGFLSESAPFARALEDVGIEFCGPSSHVLSLFGDKVASKALASDCKVPVIPGVGLVKSTDQLRHFMKTHSPVMLKASHGGGGKGMRVVHDVSQVEDLLERCRSEALKAFGSDQVFGELFVDQVKHIEIQVVCDKYGNALALGERDCSVQRQNQKVLEVTPCQALNDETRKRLVADSLTMAMTSKFEGLGTFEFLVSFKESTRLAQPYWFIECNPRIQVEHTITEEVWGVDLAQTLIQISKGASLVDLGLEKKYPRGYAMQLRINMETIGAKGEFSPAFGLLEAFNPPRGKGVRFESAAHIGYRPNQSFDNLLAKLIVWGETYQVMIRRALCALKECLVQGIATNLSFLSAIIRHPSFTQKNGGLITTQFIADHSQELLDLGKSFVSVVPPQVVLPKVHELLKDESIVVSPMQGEVVSVHVKPGDIVHVGTKLAVLNAFKMEHDITSAQSGKVRAVLVKVREVCEVNQPLIDLDLAGGSSEFEEPILVSKSLDLDAYTRQDLENVLERKQITLDAFRQHMIEEKRHGHGKRSARENINSIIDPGTWIEYGGFAIAAQRHRFENKMLIEKTQADGIVGGFASVNGNLFAQQSSRRTSCCVLSYDYLVMAGTQGARTHAKKDRLFQIAVKYNIPVLVFTEGGGGRPNDFVGESHTGLDEAAWTLLANVSAPKIAVCSGYNFAGNALLAGMCNIIIATRDSNIGMAGPAMIEGGGLGRVGAKSIGPGPMQFRNGVVHMLVEDEDEAARVAKRCLSYFQGRVARWECMDQRALRTVLPTDRKKSYDVCKFINIVADTGSVLEYSAGYGRPMITAFARIEGEPVGVVANQPLVLGGAIDANAAEKAAQFMKLCNEFKVPILFLCDTPGFIVGPAYEETGLVKQCSAMFQAASKLAVPFFTIVLRKCYGLGGMAMAGGSMKHPFFTISLPTGEFGGMGLEGAIALGFKKQLAAIEDPTEKASFHKQLLDKAYDRGHALNIASSFQIDDVIDPKDSRLWIARALETTRGVTSKL